MTDDEKQAAYDKQMEDIARRRQILTMQRVRLDDEELELGREIKEWQKNLPSKSERRKK